MSRYDTETCADEPAVAGRYGIAAPAGPGRQTGSPAAGGVPAAVPGTDAGIPATPEVLPPETPETENRGMKVEIRVPEPAPAQPAAVATVGSMAVGEIRFGITATGEPLDKSHWLADSSVCGDLVMALPSSVLVAGRTKEAAGVAVDMTLFLDAVIEGTAKLEGISGIAESASLPAWVVSRLFGSFPALMAVYSEAMDQAALAVEAAAFKAAKGLNFKSKREFSKKKTTPEGTFTESSTEEIDKFIPPDPTLSRMILTSRMKGRYNDEGSSRQAVQINIMGPEANL